MDNNFPETEQYDFITQKLNLLQLEKKGSCSSYLAPIGFLNKYSGRLERHYGKQQSLCESAMHSSTDFQDLSTTATLKIAKAYFMNGICRSSGDVSMVIDHFSGCTSSLSSEVNESVKLVVLLLASAEKVASQHFECAGKFLTMCAQFSTTTGNPVQRIVYYFAEALQKRVNRKIGFVPSEGREDNKRWLSYLEEAVTSLQPSAFAYRQQLPFFLVMQSAGIQAILESMASTEKIHLVDLAVRSGSHWIILMQALAVRYECPVDILKITAVGTTSKEMLEETGRRLSCVAESMRIPFSFRVVMVSDMGDLREDMFEVQPGEAIGVYSMLFLRNLIACPSYLENTVTVIRKLCPTVMVVTETEAYTDSPDYMDRFVEALLFYGASFDSLEACMDRFNPNRIALEAEYFRWGIQNVITFEDEERSTWHMKIDGWRNFFKSYGLGERALSRSSVYQAKLVVKRSDSWSPCALDVDGKCLLVGWKGTPIYSLSAWNFPL